MIMAVYHFKCSYFPTVNKTDKLFYFYYNLDNAILKIEENGKKQKKKMITLLTYLL